MIGIYKITNKLNNKIYIGQSVNIKHRWQQHRATTELYIDKAIHKYGAENFLWEVLEECSVDMLDERESYWIHYYNSIGELGYNLKDGSSNRGEDNSAAILTNDEVNFLRDLYNTHNYESCLDIFNTYFKDSLIRYSSFRQIFSGQKWSWFRPEVFTIENNNYYKQTQKKYQRTLNQNGLNNCMAILNEQTVMLIRKYYMTLERAEIFKLFPQYSKRVITSVISGQNWKHLPIYKKREKQWYLKGEQIDINEIWWE